MKFQKSTRPQALTKGELMQMLVDAVRNTASLLKKPMKARTDSA